MKPKVSVVVPIYNAEKYLRQCLDSIISQTLREIEIICVNDGSTDGSLAIIEEYAAKDSRIKVISKPNAGYGHSMNMGLDAATGEYLGIVDSDDYILSDMYATLYNIADFNKLDFVRSDYYHWYSSGGNEAIRYCKSINDYYNRIYCPRETSNYLCSSVLTCSGVYNLNFLRENKIRYSESPGASFQDQGFWFKVTALANRVLYINRAFYMYRFDNPNSSINDTTKIPYMDKEYDYIFDFVNEKRHSIENIIPFYWRARYQNCLFARDRVGKYLKVEDIQSLADVFRNALEQGDLDTSLFTTIQLNEINTLLNDANTFCQERIRYAELRARSTYVLIYCKNKKPNIGVRTKWYIQDNGIINAFLHAISKTTTKLTKIWPHIKEKLKKFNPTYQSIKNFERGTAARLNEIDYKNELLFWWGINQPGELLSDTKKRFFLNMPKAEGELRSLQLQFCELLQEFDNIMQANGIAYWLTSGTLLGAVRHHGFIPWDDDLDINMLDADRTRLFEVINKSEKLTIDYVYWTASAYGIQRFPQIRYKYSTFSVWIDVYFWNEGNHEPAWDSSLWKKRSQIINERKEAFYAIADTLNKRVYKGTPIMDEHDKSLIESIFDKSYSDTIKRCSGSGKTLFLTPEIRSVDIKPMVLEYRDLLPAEMMEFEGHMYPVPRETEKFLNTQFEDWLALPKRVNKTHK